MKKALSLLLALVMCLSLCACGGDKTNETSNKASNETTTPPTEEVIQNKIGDAVSTDIVEVILTNVTYEARFNDVTPKDGYSFVVIEFSMKNVGKNDLKHFPSVNGGSSVIPGSIVWVDYNDGYTFAFDDVVGKDGQNYDDSCFDFPNTYISDLKPLSDAVAFKIAICVPNEVVENTAAPLAIKFNLMNAAGETEVASYTVR